MCKKCKGRNVYEEQQQADLSGIMQQSGMLSVGCGVVASDISDEDRACIAAPLNTLTCTIFGYRTDTKLSIDCALRLLLLLL